MTISTHHAEGVIKAYTKQQKTWAVADTDSRRAGGQEDTVTLSTDGVPPDNKLEKISYSLIDILTRKNAHRSGS